MNKAGASNCNDFGSFDVGVFERGARGHSKEVSGITRREKYLKDLLENSMSARTQFATKKEAFD